MQFLPSPYLLDPCHNRCQVLRCPEWDALVRSPWRFCVSSSPPPSGRGGRPVLSPASGSQSLPPSAANRDSCACREARASETKSRAPGHPAPALKSPDRRSLHPRAATSNSPPLRRSSKILRAPKPPCLRIPSIFPARFPALAGPGPSPPAAPWQGGGQFRSRGRPFRPSHRHTSPQAGCEAIPKPLRARPAYAKHSKSKCLVVPVLPP